MHALLAAVLLWVTGLDALDADAEPQPPHRELGQSEQRVATGEGDPVVGAGGLGQSEMSAAARAIAVKTFNH